MKEQLISFEIAKLAKEKGFNYRTDNFFQYNEETFGVREESGFPKYYVDGCDQCYRPTQSLLQKWLREEYNIFVTPYPKNTKNSKGSFTVSVETNNETEYYKYGFDTHEEALEKGLQEGLKLVEL